MTRNIPLDETTRIRLILEGFNIFNRTNVAALNSNQFAGFTATSVGGVNSIALRAPAASAAFGTPRLFLGSREVQLAIKFDF